MPSLEAAYGPQFVLVQNNMRMGETVRWLVGEQVLSLYSHYLFLCRVTNHPCSSTIADDSTRSSTIKSKIHMQG